MCDRNADQRRSSNGRADAWHHCGLCMRAMVGLVWSAGDFAYRNHVREKTTTLRRRGQTAWDRRISSEPRTRCCATPPKQWPAKTALFLFKKKSDFLRFTLIDCWALCWPLVFLPLHTMRPLTKANTSGDIKSSATARKTTQQKVGKVENWCTTLAPPRAVPSVSGVARVPTEWRSDARAAHQASPARRRAKIGTLQNTYRRARPPPARRAPLS